MASEAEILTALIRARQVIRESRDHDHRPHWAGVTCPACGTDYRSVSAVDGETRQALGPTRIHKANSAESILRHCLRSKGWTAAYKHDELTSDQRIELLEEIRQYARAWLRHEAEQFSRHYLARGLAADMAGHFKRFFGRVKSFVREAIVGGVMSLLGPAPITGEDLAEAEREAIRQDQFLDRFYDEIDFWGKPSPKTEHPKPMPEPGLLVIPTPELVRPVMTPPQFIARVEKYADSSWHGAQRTNRNRAIQQGIFKRERRILGVPKTEHCDDCPPLAAKGWQPLGTLPQIGDSECGPLCLCHFEYDNGDGTQAQIMGNKGSIPAPRELDVIALPESEASDVEMIAESPTGPRENVPIAGPPR